jgi:5-hydroxyisourate hydrolase-like protein (transthyretin family)
MSRRWKILVASGVAMLLLVGLLLLARIQWVGSHVASLSVRVLDSRTGQPIAGAAVRVFRTPDSIDSKDIRALSEDRTDADGLVRLDHIFGAGGTDSLYSKTGYLYLSYETLEVHAEGYQPLRTRLDEFAARSHDLYGPPIPLVTVPLLKTPTPPN